MRLVATMSAIVVLAALGVVAVVVASDRDVVLDTNYGDPIVKRPLAVRQGGQSTLLRTGGCLRGDGGRHAECPATLPLQRATHRFDPGKPFRLTFSSVGRAEMIAGRTIGGTFRRLGHWDATVQCIDSACVSSLRFPPRPAYRRRAAAERRFPRRANTLRVVIYGEHIEGADVAIEASN
jgi:hypothetical protein